MQHFKMKEIHTLKELVSPGDWLAKSRSERRLFYNSYSPSSQEVSQVSLPRENIRVQLSSLWAPWVFTKNLKPV